MEHTNDQIADPASQLSAEEGAAAEVAYVKGEIGQTRLVTQEEALQEFPVAEVEAAPDPDPKALNLLNLIHRKVYMALRMMPPKPPAFEFDRAPMSLEEVTEAAAVNNLTLGNPRPILIMRDVMRRIGMRLAL